MSEITPNTPNPVQEDAYKNELATKLGIDPKYIPGSPIWHSEEEIAAIAEMFSNMAGSSGGGVLVVNMVDDYTDKTWKEIFDAPMAVIVQEAISGKAMFPVLQVEHNSGEYSVFCLIRIPSGEITSTKIVTNSENGYLTWE